LTPDYLLSTSLPQRRSDAEFDEQRKEFGQGSAQTRRAAQQRLDLLDLESIRSISFLPELFTPPHPGRSRVPNRPVNVDQKDSTPFKNRT
jgi:hypothetical protein